MNLTEFFNEVYRCGIDDTCQTAVNALQKYLEYGGDIHALESDSGWSILHIAAEHGDIEIINEMSKLGANLNIKDESGNAAIFQALDVDLDTAGQIQILPTFEVTIAFLKCGADSTLKNNQGKTMSEFTQSYGDEATKLFKDMIESFYS